MCPVPGKVLSVAESPSRQVSKGALTHVHCAVSVGALWSGEGKSVAGLGFGPGAACVVTSLARVRVCALFVLTWIPGPQALRAMTHNPQTKDTKEQSWLARLRASEVQCKSGDQRWGPEF